MQQQLTYLEKQEEGVLPAALAQSWYEYYLYEVAYLNNDIAEYERSPIISVDIMGLHHRKSMALNSVNKWRAQYELFTATSRINDFVVEGFEVIHS